MKLDRYLLLVAALVTLSSCGGSSSPPTTPAIIPIAPTVSATVGTEQITLNWNPVSGASSYNLYRSTQSFSNLPGGNIANYASLTEAQRFQSVTSPLTQTGLTTGTTYYFVMTTLNTAGESAIGNEVIKPQNQTPIWRSSAVISLTENSTAKVVTLVATDANNDTVTFSLSGGADSNAFTISGSELFFKNPPDFEKPTATLYQIALPAREHLLLPLKASH